MGDRTTPNAKRIRCNDDPVARIVDSAIRVVFAHLVAYIENESRHTAAVILSELREQHAGRQLYVAKGTVALRRARNEAMHAAHAAGTPIEEIAQTFHLSRRHALRIIRAPGSR